METHISFETLGCTVDYSSNSTGTHETISFDGHEIISQTGDVGPWRDKDWQESQYLSGAAKIAAQDKMLRRYVESELAAFITARAD